MEYDYSLIIPHKNSSQLLRRLLITVVSTGVQIIIVDDNSTPKEYDAIVELQKKFGFELYSNEGMYAGGARNTAMKYAKGKWMIFADSDDYFTLGFKNALEKYRDADCDIVFFNVTSCYSDTGERAYRDEHIKKISKLFCDTGNEDYLRCRYTVPWGKFYKRDLIIKNNIVFDEVIAANDMMFSVKSGMAAKSIIYDPYELYCNTVSEGSITTTLSKDLFDSKLMVTLRVNDILRVSGKKEHRVSILYFLAQSSQFGVSYAMHVLIECIRHRSNFLIGAKKLFHYKKVLQDRQNAAFVIRRKG